VVPHGQHLTALLAHSLRPRGVVVVAADRALYVADEAHGATTLLASTPMRSTSASILSPAFKNLPSAAPTPSGVPVAMTSPGWIVKPCDRTAMHSSMGKII